MNDSWSNNMVTQSSHETDFGLDPQRYNLKRHTLDVDLYVRNTLKRVIECWSDIKDDIVLNVIVRSNLESVIMEIEDLLRDIEEFPKRETKRHFFWKK